MTYLCLSTGVIELCECGDKYVISEEGRNSLDILLRECTLKKVTGTSAIEFILPSGVIIGSPIALVEKVDKIDFPFDYSSYSCPVDDNNVEVIQSDKST